jgi:hypothetical protein
MTLVQNGPGARETTGVGRRFPSFEALIEHVGMQKRDRLAELESLQHAYRKVVGKEDPLVAEKIRRISEEFDGKIATLTEWRSRFLGMMADGDKPFMKILANADADLESDPCYSHTEDEGVRQRIRARTLSEGEYYGSLYPFAPAPEEAAADADGTEPKEPQGGEEDEEPVPMKKLLLSHIPKGERSAFHELAKGNPRLKELEARENPTKEEIDEAIAAFNQGKKAQTAMVRHEAASLAPDYGIGVSRVQEYLQVYSPEQLRAIAAVAAVESLAPRRLVSADLMIFEDGSLSQRMSEAIALVKFRDGMERIISSEYSRFRKLGYIFVAGLPRITGGAREDNQAQSRELEELWKRILAKHGGDVEAAKEEFSVESAKMLTSDAGPVTADKPYSFGLKQAFEIFKLLNYDTWVLDHFLDYFESNFDLVTIRERAKDSETPQKCGMARLPGDVLTVLYDFVRCYNEAIDLNERSRYYHSMRRTQLRAMERNEDMPPPQWVEDVDSFQGETDKDDR